MKRGERKNRGFEVKQIECEGALICILWLCLKMLIKVLQTSDSWG